MRNERKYRIISLLTVVLSVLLLGNCFREPWRMDSSVYRQHEEYVLKGAKVYAENCVQCHGPRGEGVTGMPLNRKVFQVDYESPAGKEIYNMIYATLDRGRPGNSEHFQWEKTPNGYWISYSTMPPWGRDNGGPLDNDYLKALALFIMKADGTQWDLIGDEEKAPIPRAKLDPDETGKIPLPTPQGVPADVTASAQALLRNLGKSQCLTCHKIGSSGGYVGPDLTRVGSWGIDQAFLEEWIKYAAPNEADKVRPQAMPHDRRMPVYWSANRATLGPNLNLEDKIISEGPYAMPRFKDRLTDAEIAILAQYLMGLK